MTLEYFITILSIILLVSNHGIILLHEGYCRSPRFCELIICSPTSACLVMIQCRHCIYGGSCCGIKSSYIMGAAAPPSTFATLSMSHERSAAPIIDDVLIHKVPPKKSMEKLHSTRILFRCTKDLVLLRH